MRLRGAWRRWKRFKVRVQRINDAVQSDLTNREVAERIDAALAELRARDDELPNLVAAAVEVQIKGAKSRSRMRSAANMLASLIAQTCRLGGPSQGNADTRSPSAAPLPRRRHPLTAACECAGARLAVRRSWDGWQASLVRRAQWPRWAFRGIRSRRRCRISDLCDASKREAAPDTKRL
jgi:hypothetical protein